MAASVAAAALLPICRVALRALPLKRFAPPRWALTDLRRRIPGCGMIRHTGQRVEIREHAPKARDFTNRRYRHRGVVDEVERARNRTKSKVRARVGSYWAAKGRNVSATRPATVQPPQYGIYAAQ